MNVLIHNVINITTRKAMYIPDSVAATSSSWANLEKQTVERNVLSGHLLLRKHGMGVLKRPFLLTWISRFALKHLASSPHQEEQHEKQMAHVQCSSSFWITKQFKQTRIVRTSRQVLLVCHHARAQIEPRRSARLLEAQVLARERHGIFLIFAEEEVSPFYIIYF